ncbi:MAG: DegT/DnrJ/EryC1/StrS family aminotransferase [Armatimonadetes bacterium]|nr:DegT/DnrJ/EryC1/StrS family aminotransferase [Armatimonadota bacterium]
MRVPFLDIRAQHAEVAAELEPVVLDILRTGAYVVGQHNKGLEAEIAALHGMKHGIAVNSGTDALRIMMQAAGIGPGDEVITSAFTFVATIEAMIQIGARPVFVDIDPVSFCIDPNLIEAAITERTKAIMPVHLFGQLCAIREIKAIADRHGLLVFEDSAQALENHNNGDFAGKFGVATGLSFYVTKNLGAAGDGGMILTDSDEVDFACRSLRIHGMGKERYYYDSIGYTSRMAELQAAVLRFKLKKLPHWTARRQELAAIYNSGLAGSSVITPETLEGNNHCYHQYTIRTEGRDELQAFLKEREVDSMIYYPVPLHFHEPYKYLGFTEGDLPQTEEVSRQCLSLPIHQHLGDEHVQFVTDSILEFSKVGSR